MCNQPKPGTRLSLWGELLTYLYFPAAALRKWSDFHLRLQGSFLTLTGIETHPIINTDRSRLIDVYLYIRAGNTSFRKGSTADN